MKCKDCGMETGIIGHYFYTDCIAYLRSRVEGLWQQVKLSDDYIRGINNEFVTMRDRAVVAEERVKELVGILKDINKWCGTDDGAKAMPFQPPWYPRLHEAICEERDQWARNTIASIESGKETKIGGGG